MTASQSFPPRGFHQKRPLRILLPAILILLWITAGAIGGPYFGRIDEVSSNDPTAYLPTSAESTQVQHRLADFLGEDAIPAIILITADTKLSTNQLNAINHIPSTLPGIDGVLKSTSPAIPSEDGKAVEIAVPLNSNADVASTVDALRTHVDGLLPSGTAAYVTGPAGFTSDLVNAFAGIDGLLLLVAVLAVFVILVLVYRSPLLPLLVLASSMFALCAALLTVWWLAKAGIFPLSGQTQGILFILVIGAATDYSLLYVSRYREALLHSAKRGDATKAALKGSVEPILASAGTVIAGLLMLLFSELGSNRALGPIAAIGIVFAALSAFTLLPSLLFFAGRAAFWPRAPRFGPSPDASGRVHASSTGLWARIPRFIRTHARPIWIISVILLLTAAAGISQLKADGVPSSDLVLGSSEARTGQKLLGTHFPGGSGSPVYVIIPAEKLVSTANTMLGIDGVQAVSVASKESPSGTAQVTSAGVKSLIPGRASPTPTTVDGNVLLEATLTHAADSQAAADTLHTLRTSISSDALVGGVSATDVDTNDASIRDRNLIIPLILLVVFLILVLLLRAILAPLLLISTVVLSFAATMGVSAFVFNDVMGLPGADPSVPLFGFVFLVALGVDYNIFLMTRVREEALVVGARAGMSRGLSITGGVITSAGIVLASTFAALAVIPVLFLLQLAFIVAFGVLLDTVIVRTLLVPALGFELGRSLWWPSRKIRA
ncbi:MAG: MMPL family transporter [Microbacteriaceae bacterium]|nr:MMPL family transporter [Microbacteriaceae bacterium]MCI1206960.1 MMPL family transporter [Microbacteriaceae bacterium]